MTKTKTTDREAESKRARTLIAAHVEREASDLSTDDRNDLIATAIEDWLNSKGSELECARRTVSAFFRKRNRQSKIREQRALDIAKASHGGRDNIEAERTRVYGKAEESELRAAVMKHCREAYQKSWGKLWDPKKAGRIRELCQPGDAIHVKAEAEANGYLQDLSNALRRSLAWTSGIPGADVYGPTIGGPAA